MGYRYHKSIKIAKGVRLNISKNGFGLSVGPRGAKVSLNSKGVYANVGIPGSGFSVRRKIAGVHEVSKDHGTQKLLFRYTIEIDEETGKEQLTVTQDGNPVTDQTIIRKIRRNPEFRKNLEREYRAVYRKIQEQTEVLTGLCCHSQHLPDWDRIRKELEESKPRTYEKLPFSVPRPSMEQFRQTLEEDARQHVTSIFFRRKKIASYVSERLDDRYREAVAEWERRRAEHEAGENRREEERNAAYFREYVEWKEGVQRILAPDRSFVEKRLEALLADIRLPLDFSICFDVLQDGREIVLDIDLPEIEDFPQRKARMLASGKVSVKRKSQKERNHDYLVTVTGLGFYFASIAFSVSPIVETLLVSGYTQRIDKATGNERDRYVYSVFFPLDEFRKLNLAKLDPSEAIGKFRNRLQVSDTYGMKAIEPFSP
jgi:hypothetical protein